MPIQSDNDTTANNQQEALQWSEARFRILLEKTKHAVALSDRNMKIHYISSAIEQILGYLPDEYLRLENRFDLIHPDDREKSLAVIATLLQTPNESSVVEYRARHKNGTYRWLEVTFSNFLEEPDVAAFVASFRDISERKRAEEYRLELLAREQKARQQVEEREEHYHFLADAMPQQVWTATPDGALDYVNQQTVDYFERSANEIVGAGWQSVIHPDDLLQCLHEWQHSLQTGHPYQVEFRLRAGNGTYRWHLGRALPLMNDGQIVKWFGTNTDVDEYKKLQSQKDEFISMASHELRTPMTTIKAWTQIQKKRFEKQGIEEVVYSFNKMETQINKVNRLIADLLDVSKIQVGKLSYATDDIAINDVVHESVEMVQQTSVTHAIIVHGGTDKHIIGDRDRLEQVFTNLLNNAMKYSPHATTVDIFIETMQDSVLVKVQDYGIGIPREHKGKIFERFYRVSDGESPLFPGLGMGLYLACEIIVRHGGNITVESQEGKGSVFTVMLPVTPEMV